MWESIYRDRIFIMNSSIAPRPYTRIVYMATTAHVIVPQSIKQLATHPI